MSEYEQLQVKKRTVRTVEKVYAEAFKKSDMEYKIDIDPGNK